MSKIFHDPHINSPPPLPPLTYLMYGPELAGNDLDSPFGY